MINTRFIVNSFCRIFLACLMTALSLSVLANSKSAGSGVDLAASLLSGGSASNSVSVATLSDQEVRALLISKLAEEESASVASVGAKSLSVQLLNGLQSFTMRLQIETDNSIAALSDAPMQMESVLRNLTGDQGWSVVGHAAGVFLLMIALAAALEWLVERWLGGFQKRVQESNVVSGGFGFLFMGTVFRLLGLLVFVLAAYVVSLVFFDRFDPLRVLVTTWLFILAAGRGGKILLEWLLPSSGSKWIEIDSADSRFLCRAGVMLISVAAFGILHCSLFSILGVSEHLHRLMLISSGVITALLSVSIIWISRDMVASFWFKNSMIDPESATAVWIKSWHVPLMMVVLFTCVLWILNTMIGRASGAGAAFNLMAVVVVGLFVRAATDVLEKHIKTGPPSGLMSIATRMKTPRRGLLVIGLVLMIAFLTEALGLGTFGMVGAQQRTLVLNSAFSITGTLIVAWITWEMIRSFIDRYLPEDAFAETSLEFDGEGGEGAPASRAETLLPLLRGFLLVVVVVIAVLTVLSSMGINIAPLLAGAGVVGLAVGFGAQKLVQDVISGIFFLVDDAFRTGEYIETAGMRGTVEKISIRSIRLRHHLGPVQTVPYSEMATVKNHSRDYIIMKLKFRLRYDVDIEKVRKIIKKIGQQMMADEELGPGFLAPLKSQGVLEMEDSAMVMRMKFTAKPGEQWVIRREAYRRVRDALRADGIEFAHRQVTVHLPETDKVDPDKLKQIAGAAAQLEQEQEKPVNEDTR
ncbi:MAG: small-conductance mechanosensitive channel [Parasphingorhabdus sp.]|jgi:small-conductance mechanosensitive channel